jgi:hypothetical protein
VLKHTNDVRFVPEHANDGCQNTLRPSNDGSLYMATPSEGGITCVTKSDMENEILRTPFSAHTNQDTVPSIQALFRVALFIHRLSNDELKMKV